MMTKWFRFFGIINLAVGVGSYIRLGPTWTTFINIFAGSALLTLTWKEDN